MAGQKRRELFLQFAWLTWRHTSPDFNCVRATHGGEKIPELKCVCDAVQEERLCWQRAKHRAALTFLVFPASSTSRSIEGIDTWIIGKPPSNTTALDNLPGTKLLCGPDSVLCVQELRQRARPHWLRALPPPALHLQTNWTNPGGQAHPGALKEHSTVYRVYDLELWREVGAGPVDIFLIFLWCNLFWSFIFSYIFCVLFYFNK